MDKQARETVTAGLTGRSMMSLMTEFLARSVHSVLALVCLLVSLVRPVAELGVSKVEGMTNERN